MCRWLAVGKAPAAGAASATSQAADASKLPASAGAASQAAGEGQPQAPQQAAPSGMADPSRWLSEEGYNTLKWQVCSYTFRLILHLSCSRMHPSQ